MGFENDFYRVDGPDPDLVENSLSEIEALAAPIVRRVERDEELPTGTDFDILVNLLALLAARVHRQRQAISRMLDWMAQSALSLYVQTPERFEAIMRKVRAENPDLPVVSYETMRDSVLRREMRFQVDRTWLVARMWEQASTLVELLGRRRWSLLIARPDAPRFVCSDNPVYIVLERGNPGLYAAGWGMPMTLVCAPLTAKIAMVGSYERSNEPALVGTPIIAEMNRSTVLLARRFVFSQEPDFIWHQQGRYRHASDLGSALLPDPDD